MVNDNDTVLFISPGPDLVNPASGEGARLKHLSQGLAAEGWETFALVPEDVATEPEWMHRTFTYEQWSAPFLTDLNPSFARSLGSVLTNEDVDVVHLSNGVCTAAAIVRASGLDTSVVYAAQNVEAAHARDFVDPELPLYKRAVGPNLIPWIERATVACADAITTVSQKDRDEFVARYGVAEDSNTAVPTGTQQVDPSELRDPKRVREDLGLDPKVPVAVFHGSYAHPPNEEAVEEIVQRITPAIRDRGLDLQFLLVGKGVPEFSRPNVVSAGFVDDLLSVLNAADFAVVPIKHGGGTKTKVFDYISVGLPIVSTEKAVEGIDVVDGKHGTIEHDVDDTLIDRVAQFAAGDADILSYQANVEELAEELDWSRSVDRLTEFYDVVTES